MSAIAALWAHLSILNFVAMLDDWRFSDLAITRIGTLYRCPPQCKRSFGMKRKGNDIVFGDAPLKLMAFWLIRIYLWECVIQWGNWMQENLEVNMFFLWGADELKHWTQSVCIAWNQNREFVGSQMVRIASVRYGSACKPAQAKDFGSVHCKTPKIKCYLHRQHIFVTFPSR